MGKSPCKVWHGVAKQTELKMDSNTLQKQTS